MVLFKCGTGGDDLRTFYTIIKSRTMYIGWRIIGWTENPYVAISYFREYQQMDRQALMFSLRCNSVLQLFEEIEKDYDIDLESFLDTHLLTKTSKDERCYVIYQEKYSGLFHDSYIKNHTNTLAGVCDTISKVLLGLSMIMKYLSNDTDPELSDFLYSVIFNAYLHISNKRMQKITEMGGRLSVDIDLVYFWRFVNTITTIYGSLINTEQDKQPYQPYYAVFIDSK